LAAVATLLLVGSCGGETVGGQAAADLWGRKFVSVAVSEDGESRPLVADTRIESTFEKRDDGGVLRGEAGCNTMGSEVEIAADRLVTGEVAGTAVLCRGELHQQDDWLAEFFGSDPYWNLTDRRLVLASGETLIELRERD
jgi:heat shock protein HslJ